MWKSWIIIKNQKQIEWIRRSWRLAAKTLDYIEKFVKPWVSTLELDNLMNDFILDNWWKSACIGYMWYPKYTCISVNDVVCHGIPSKKQILKKWDIVNIDVTTIVGWYFGDTSRMYAVWEITPENQKLIDDTLKALEIGIKEVRPWNHFGNIWYKIAEFAKKKWYGVVREYTGHGVWIEFHEEPYVMHIAPKNSGQIMRPGMIFTIEPMINAGTHKTKVMPDEWTVKTNDNKNTAQFEHTILVTKTGYEILTPWHQK